MNHLSNNRISKKANDKMDTNSKRSSANGIWTKLQWPSEIHSQVCLWIKVTKPHTQLLNATVRTLIPQHDIQREICACVSDLAILPSRFGQSLLDVSDILMEHRETVGACHRSTASTLFQ